jgi:hypothetical protein
MKLKGSAMKVRYFSDTDTLLISLSDKRIAETRDITDNISSSWMTRPVGEHDDRACHPADRYPRFSFQQVAG